MSMKFVSRFVVVLVLVMILSALSIQFFFNPDYTIVFWILAVPVILGAPILASVVLASNEELDLHQVN
ncbi:hypothetical protein [Acinetobacter indicus]|uniref:hypothetical protein n=1 Tax=Acinetobacter indicus TaxID=756892 RepID=UPI000CEC0483|nr:hypothetical protein [Acinetobacter indicus]